MREQALIRNLMFVAFLAASGWAAAADVYPSKPIRMMVPVPPGGVADTVARLVLPRVSEALGQPIVMDNRAGANGNIAYAITARAVPDGYTLVTAATGIAINPSLYRDAAFDPLQDFAPISLGVKAPNILLVHPSVAATSVKELVALARAKPGQITFASPGNGTTGHLAVELLRASAGIQVIHVPYKGGGPALIDLMGGQVQAYFSVALVAVPLIKAGKLRALGITSAKRSPVAPEMMTVSEAGFPGFEVSGWFGWLAPAKTPRNVVVRLNTEIVKALNAPDIRERLLSQSTEPAGGTPEAFAAFIRSEHARWGRVIRESGIKLE
jgi:tripartite-type tricarboxylate transporter receptor subunit TctC